MIQKLGKFLKAEWRLHRHNKLNKRGVVDPCAQDSYLLTNVFPNSTFEELLSELAELKSSWVRGENNWRRGFAIGGHELNELCTGEWLDYLNSSDFKSRVREAIGLPNLEYVSVKDTNRISLLLYQGLNGGDGIDWHVDGSIYLGERWAGILTLVEQTSEDSAKLELEKDNRVKTFLKKDMVNTLVLFRGDHIKHRVRPMLDGDERIVISMLFSDWPRMTLNPFLRLYQSRVNKAFYNNRSL